jgi:hypothetical protein
MPTYTNRQTGRRADGQTGRRADGQTGRRADGQTGREWFERSGGFEGSGTLTDLGEVEL